MKSGNAQLPRPVDAPPPTAIVSARIETPLGPMAAMVRDWAVCLLEFADRPMLGTQVERVARRFGSAPTPGRHPLLDALKAELDEYFRGERRGFDVPLALSGTPFQTRVWRLLMEIPYGDTISYDELARRAEKPGGQRAVGRANGDNRIAVVIPCHRVVRASGELGGYGGGLDRKRRLLALEQGHASQGTLFGQRSCTGAIQPADHPVP